MKCPGCGQNENFELVFEAVWKCDRCLRIFISGPQPSTHVPLKVLDGNENFVQRFERKLISPERTAASSGEFEMEEPRRLLRSHR
jgi:hypothetical protein